MRKTFFILALITLSCLRPATAQIVIYEYMTYDWDSYPQLTLTDQDTSNNSIIIFSRLFYEYAYENNTLLEFMITHKRVKLITHAGIENNNKVYLPLGDDDKVMAQKARVIKPDGSVFELKKEDFKEGFYEETGRKYRYFAFEGIETGCEIEYIYCVKRTPDLNGNIVNLQTEQPVLKFEARYTTPRGLWFKFKSYNGCPEVFFDNTDPVFKDKFKKKNIWVIKKENIPPLTEEDYSAPRAERMKYAMKLDRVSNSGEHDKYSYASLAANVIDEIYNHSEPKDAGLISKLIEIIKPMADNTEDSIRGVENYLKTNFIYDYNLTDGKTTLSKIIANKTYNDYGALKLYANVFKKLNIETQIVLTGNRFEQKFDKEFECYSFLNEYLLYFPALNKYLSPADNFSRLGFPDYENINTSGLFVRTALLDGKSKGVGEINFIEGAKFNESSDRLIVHADLTSDFNEIKIEIQREMSGYAASAYQPYFDFIKEETKLKDHTEEIVKYIDKHGNIEQLTVENKGGNFYGQKPLIAKAVLTSNNFFDKAGDKYLFKAGMLIGPQKGLYEKYERKLPLEFPYSRHYLRSITFNIPEGYKVSGLEKLKSKESYVRNPGDTSMIFMSDYQLTNNTVTVTVEEYYKEYSHTIGEFEDYRRVVNAAADFNKVVLVFEKK